MVNSDYTYQLTSYLKKNIRKGYPTLTLRQALINQGHAPMSVDRAIKMVEQELAREAPILKTKPIIKREVIPISQEAEQKRKSFFDRLFGD